MYFIRDKNIKSKVNLDDFSQVFNYEKLIYKEHKNNFLEMLNNDSNLLCDLSASLLTNIYKTSYAHKDIFEKSLDACEKIIQNIGYKSISKKSFLEDFAKKNGTHILITFGCQNQQMLKNRVEKSAQFSIDSRTNLHVIFSGNNPSDNQRNRIVNEYLEMEKYFLRYLEQHQAPSPKINTINYESQSQNTSENIDFIINNIKNIVGNEKHLYIVSSSFHLIRLSEKIEDNIEKLNIGEEGSINLIGAEKINYDFHACDTFSSQYLRSMLFDIFRHMLIEYPKEKRKKGSDVENTPKFKWWSKLSTS